VSFGTIMAVFPDVVPQLNIIDVAGTSIPESQQSAVQVMLPFGSSPSRTVTVLATGFQGKVPINVVLTPANGTPLLYPAEIAMSAKPGQAVVQIQVPVNILTTVEAWTR